MFYDGNDWTIEVFDSDTEDTLFQVYADPNIYHDGKHPPFGVNDWYGFDSINAGGSYKLKVEDYDIECFNTLHPTDAPSFSPSQPPTGSPSVEPSSSPTNAPVFSPTDVPTDSPTEEPTPAPTDEPTAMPTDPTSEPTHMPTLSCELLKFTVLEIDDPDDELDDDEDDVIEGIEGGYLQENTLLFSHTWWSRDFTINNDDDTDETEVISQKVYWQNNEWILSSYFDTLTVSDENGLFSDQPPTPAVWQSTNYENVEYRINSSICGVSTFAPSNQPSQDPTSEPSFSPTAPTNSPSQDPTNRPTESPTLKPTGSGDTIIAGDGDEAAFGLTWLVLILILIAVLCAAVIICVWYVKHVNKAAAEGRLVTHTARQSRGQSAKSPESPRLAGAGSYDRAAAGSKANAAGIGGAGAEAGAAPSGLSINGNVGGDAINITSASPSSAGAAAMIASVPKSPKGQKKGRKGTSPQEIELMEQHARDRANTNFVQEEEEEPALPVVAGTLQPPEKDAANNSSGSLDRKLTDTLATEMASEDNAFADALANAHRRATFSPDEHADDNQQGKDDYDDGGDALDI